MRPTPGSGGSPLAGVRIALVANTDWHLHNFRMPLAVEARRLGADVVLVSPPGPYLPGLCPPGLRFVPISLSQRGATPLRDIGLVGQLARIYRTERVDLAHHFSIKPVIYGSVAARLAAVRATVNSVTGMGYVYSDGAGVRRRLMRWVVDGLYRAALGSGESWMTFQHEDDREFFLARAWARPERCVIIQGSGADLTRLHPGAGAPADRPTVLFVGRLLWDKGVADFREAASRLRSAGVQADFWIAGRPQPDHPGGVPVEVLDAWRDEGVVQVLGHRDDIAELMARAWLVVLPTRYGEGVPKSLLEAAAMGKPLVATDTPGCREVVRPGVSGALVPPGDVAALSEAIRALIGDAELRESLGRGARRVAEAEFDVRSVVSRTTAVYREALRLSARGQG